MSFSALGRDLMNAHAFSEVGAVISEHLRADFAGHQSVSILFAAGRSFAMVVDDVPIGAFTDAQRIEYIRSSAIDPQLAVVLDTHHAHGDDSTAAAMHELAVSLGYKGEMLRMHTLPMIGPGGVFAAIRFGTHASITSSLCRDLGVVAAYAAARCVQLGIASLEELPIRLSPRQREVMELATRGHTNLEIGAALGTSLNTVKKQLKDIFDRCGVSNRTELASLRTRYALCDPAPRGTTTLGAVTITR